ncbi:MAG: SDR family NAD(P)-dependent oxidoreductase [Acidimicrobiales bacterium]|nr:SDR family NAD(P)-dependent oxidoreductase [Acidimicrobiales bacterium]
MKLEPGQVAVITGAASGIGLGLAEALGGRGLGLVMADVEGPALRQAAADLEGRGVPVLAVTADVSDPAAMEALAVQTLSRFGHVDVVCNNAGVVGPWAPMWELQVSDWAWTFGVNLWGVVNGIRAFVPHLVAQGSGHVINTASMGGLRPLPGNGPYCATKHAVVALTETLQAELDMKGSPVRATVVCPSVVATNISTSARNRPADLGVGAAPDKSLRPGAASRKMVSPVVLQPSDVAAAILAGVEADKLYVLPSPGSDEILRARSERVLSQL